jgi:uncharacterized membrane protein YdbT with pleckstrin-like domain
MAENTEDSVEGHQAGTTGITLLDGEYVLANVRPAWSEWALAIIIAGVFALVTLGAAAGGDIGTAVSGLIITGLITAYVYYSRSRSRYVVTTQRVKKDVGLIRNVSGEVRITDIRSLNTGQGIIQRMAGKGNVKIDSGGSGGELGIDNIADHETVARSIREQQQRTEANS